MNGNDQEKRHGQHEKQRRLIVDAKAVGDEIEQRRPRCYQKESQPNREPQQRVFGSKDLASDEPKDGQDGATGNGDEKQMGAGTHVPTSASAGVFARAVVASTTSSRA